MTDTVHATTSLEHLPVRLAAPARRALKAARIAMLGDLARWHEEDVLKLHGMGPRAMATLHDALAEAELTVKTDTKE